MRALMANVDPAHLLADIRTNCVASLAIGAMMLLLVGLERLVPNARPPSSRHAWFNVRYTVIMVALVGALQPLLIGIPLTMTRALGAGWVSFPTGVAGACCAFVCVLLMTDLLEYLFHRAQHSIGFMWKMHELHHSAPHYDVTLAYRHFWAEGLIKTALLYPLIGIVFSVPTSVATAVGLVFAVNHHVAHLNLRFSPRRVTLLFSHPQYHRLHHSRHERDYNKNFCDLLPLWDILFGTLHRPAHDEFVDVGLDSGAAPGSIVSALLWPWRREQPAGFQAVGLVEEGAGTNGTGGNRSP
jgi:sterol desaturase/sphingolipid hydroxylase (fatty acid hydroxylase superfamily)